MLIDVCFCVSPIHLQPFTHKAYQNKSADISVLKYIEFKCIYLMLRLQNSYNCDKKFEKLIVGYLMFKYNESY